MQISGTVIEGNTRMPIEEARVVITREEDGVEVAFNKLPAISWIGRPIPPSVQTRG
jgi:hypothetical protein